MKAYNQLALLVQRATLQVPTSKSAIKQFVNTLVLRECRIRTITKHIRLICILARHFDKSDIASLDRNHLESFVLWLLNSQYTKGTREEIKMSVRLFYKLLGQPEKVLWIKARKLKSTLENASILLEEEVFSMIQAVQALRDKAIIALLYDTGIRPEELLGLRFGDVDLTGFPCHIKVNGKTGPRSIPLTFSARYLAKYMDSTPRLIDGTLWVREDKGTKSGALGSRGVDKMLKIAALKVGIKKRVYIYLFRHSAYTRDSKKYKEAILKLKYGWCKGSEMPEVYGHLDYTELDKVVLDNSGEIQPNMQSRLDRIEKNQNWIISRLGG